MPVDLPPYPVNLLLAGRRVLVVGGGAVAAEKVRGCSTAGAVVHVVALEVGAEVRALDGHLGGAALRARRGGRLPARGGLHRRPGRQPGRVRRRRGGGRLGQRRRRSRALLLHAAGPAATRVGCSSPCPPAATARPWPAGSATSWRAQLGPEHDTLIDLLAEARAALVAEGRPTLGADWRSALDSGMLDLVRAGRLDEARRLLRASLALTDPTLPDRRARSHCVSVVVIGLNHRSTPLDLLERMTIGDARAAQGAARPRLPRATSPRPSCSPPATAPRSTRSPSGSTAPTRTSATSSPSSPSWRPRTSPTTSTSTTTPPAVAHLFAVAAGLDSAVLGESEILGQVKQAWERAREEGAAGPALNLLFRHALEAGKRARTDTGIARNITSVSQAAVAMAAERLGGLAGRRSSCSAPARWARRMALGLAKAGRRAPRRQPHLGARPWTSPRASAAGPCACSTLPAALAEVDVLLVSTGAAVAAARARRRRAR